jgi:uncharacterized membrane protein YeaQ/YmgE (transglycosylase-associated protein family)
MGILSWVIFGALAGWVANLITGNSRRMGCLLNMVVGIAGAVIGGFLMEVLAGFTPYFGWTLRSFLVAVVGAILLLAVTGMIGRRRA